jgi:hypothetical protein
MRRRPSHPSQRAPASRPRVRCRRWAGGGRRRAVHGRVPSRHELVQGRVRLQLAAQVAERAEPARVGAGVHQRGTHQIGLVDGVFRVPEVAKVDALTLPGRPVADVHALAILSSRLDAAANACIAKPVRGPSARGGACPGSQRVR